jgi:hypothetical protein
MKRTIAEGRISTTCILKAKGKCHYVKRATPKLLGQPTKKEHEVKYHVVDEVQNRMVQNIKRCIRINCRYKNLHV